jgi:hypothetical protein
VGNIGKQKFLVRDVIINGGIVVEVHDNLTSREKVSDRVKIGGEGTLEERHWERGSIAVTRIVLVSRVVVVGTVDEPAVFVTTNDDYPSILEGLQRRIPSTS